MKQYEKVCYERKPKRGYCSSTSCKGILASRTENDYYGKSSLRGAVPRVIQVDVGQQEEGSAE